MTTGWQILTLGGPQPTEGAVCAVIPAAAPLRTEYATLARFRSAWWMRDLAMDSNKARYGDRWFELPDPKLPEVVP